MDSVTARGPARQDFAFPFPQCAHLILRIAAVPVVAVGRTSRAVDRWMARCELRWVALAEIVAAGGDPRLSTVIMPEIWDRRSAFGRMLDPIADKLPGRVLPRRSSPLTALSMGADAAARPIVILCREIRSRACANIWPARGSACR